MKIFEVIDNALAELEVPFYYGMPEFAEGEEPEIFISYSVYDTPAARNDGSEVTTRYTATFSIFSRTIEDLDSCEESLRELLRGKKFFRTGGSWSSSDDFPRYERRTIDYTYILEVM